MMYNKGSPIENINSKKLTSIHSILWWKFTTYNSFVSSELFHSFTWKHLRLKTAAAGPLTIDQKSDWHKCLESIICR